MARVFSGETQVQSLTLSIESGTFPVSSVQINAAVGQLPSCSVTIMQGEKVFTHGNTPDPVATMGTEASVTLNTDEGSFVLMSGLIGGSTSAVATGPASVQLKTTFQILSAASFLDGIPLGEMYFVSQEDGSPNTSVKSAFNRAAGTLWNAEERAEINLAKTVAKMIDKLGESGKSVGLGNSLSSTLNTSTCPSMALSFPDSAPLSKNLEARILEIIGGTPVFAAYCSIIRNFFLEVVPDFPGSNGLLMKVIPKIAWAKEARAEIGTPDITATSAMYSGKGRNEIDGVAVKYTLSAGENQSGSEDLRSTAVYAECGGGKPHLVTNVQELRDTNARLITIPLPYFVAYGMKNLIREADIKRPGSNRATKKNSAKDETDWAKRWAEIIAQMTFAAVNRSGNSAKIAMPFMKFLAIRDHLGEVVSAEIPWTPGSNGMIGGHGGTAKKYGYFSAWNLMIDIGYDKIAFTASIVLTSVRSEEENDALGIDESLLYG